MNKLPETTEISELKHIRKKIELTQNELAKKSGVSQSLIAKIESGRLDPSYSKAMKIIKTLDSLTEKNELKAEQIMNKKIVFAQKNEEIKEIIQKLKKYQISQLPVIENNKCIGLVSESILLNAILNRKVKKVWEIMDDAPPTISKNATSNIITELLKFYPMILVSEGERYVGIITKSDLLLKIYGKNN